MRCLFYEGAQSQKQKMPSIISMRVARDDYSDSDYVSILLRILNFSKNKLYYTHFKAGEMKHGEVLQFAQGHATLQGHT